MYFFFLHNHITCNIVKSFTDLLFISSHNVVHRHHIAAKTQAEHIDVARQRHDMTWEEDQKPKHMMGNIFLYITTEQTRTVCLRKGILGHLYFT